MQTDDFTISEFRIKVGDNHELYVQDWGNRAAKTPFIFLHGGPGSGVKDKHKSAFDPSTHRVIFFDQRGCGRSAPHGSLENNTTQDLVGDITKIADYLKIDKFYLHGSSWGSTLSLTYALENSDRVKGLVIGGVFTGSQFEIDWQDKGAYKTFFPDVWQKYVDATPRKFSNNPTEYYFDVVFNGSPEEQKRASYIYGQMEYAIMTLDDRSKYTDYETYDPAPSKIEMYYLKNHCFVPDRFILDNAHKLTIPIHIVQGRYDFVCPPITAYELCEKAPNAKLYWALSGHAAEHENENIFRAIFASLE